MIRLQQSVLSLTIALVVLTSLTACSGMRKVGSFLSDKRTVNYQKNTSVKNLEFPPDLTAPQFDSEFDLPSGTVSTVSMRTGGVISTNNTYSVNPPPSNTNTIPNYRSRSGNLSSIQTQSGKAHLQIHDTYPRALILTDIMLERMGFIILSRNTSAGIYTVQYNGKDVASGNKRGWFSRVKNVVGLSRSSKALSKGKTYQVHIIKTQGFPLVRFKSAAGQEIVPASHTKIITILNNEFNR